MSSTNVLGLAACYRGKHNQYVTPPNHVQSNSDTNIEYRSLLNEIEHLKKVNKALQSNNIKTYHKDAHICKEIARKVKYDIFKEIKFITCQEDLDDLDSSTSIGKKVIDLFDVQPEDQYSFWNTYKDTVKKALCTRRNDVNNSIQTTVMHMFQISKNILDGTYQEYNDKNNIKHKTKIAKSKHSNQSLKDMHEDKITPETQQIILNYSDDDDSDAEDNENTLQDNTNVESFENNVQNGLKPPEALDSRLISMFWFCFIVGCLLLCLQ